MDGREYNKVLFILLLVLIPFTFGISGLVALVYYLTRKKNVLEITIREDPNGTAIMGNANGVGAIRVLSTLTQMLSSSLMPGSLPPFVVNSTRSYRKVVTGAFLLVLGIAILILDAISIKCGGVFFISLAPFVASAYYFRQSEKTYITNLPISYVNNPPQSSSQQIQGGTGNVENKIVNFLPDKVCLNCGATVKADMAFCPNCGSPIEKVYAIIHSPNIWPAHRHIRGYAILITDKRVAGRGWHKLMGDIAYARYYSYYLAGAENGRAPLSISIEEYRKAYDEAYNVAKKPDFSLDKSMITRVIIKPKGTIRNGYINIESPNGTVKINMTLKKKHLNYRFLVSGFKELLGDNAVIELQK
ncbi:hypothetical protein HS5_04590 [Acidianus sp. HS-5]|nr:hypothetical protein HS5_04590 [Acidianus sp. HS-5]